MTRAERTELIERYLNSELVGIELKRFHDQLENNADLKRELQLETELREAINTNSDYNIFTKNVQKVETTYSNKKRDSSRLNWRVAAVVSLLVTSSISLWLLYRPLSPDQVFDRNFEPYVIQTIHRGVKNELDEYMLGSVYYRDGDYQDAIEQFSKVLEKEPTDYRAQLLSGISYLALKDFDQAEQFLKSLAMDESHLFQDQARWYLGLTYLTDKNVGNDREAEEYFEEIEDDNLLEQVARIR